MKKVVLLNLIILLFACNQSTEHSAKNDTSKEMSLETETEKESTNEEEIISSIRKSFNDINQNIDSYETTNVELMGESTEGGELKSYYQNEELKKVVVSYFGEMGKSVKEYYFSENNLFFVFSQQFSYDKPITIEEFKVDKIEENRYYFHNNKLIRWIDPNKEKVSNSKFNEKESEIFQKVKELEKKRAKK